MEMKKWLVFLVFGMAMLHAGAQTIDSRAVGYSVRYEKKHLFLQKDSGLNVVDYDIEWPEVVGYSHVPALQRLISQALTGKGTWLPTVLRAHAHHHGGHLGRGGKGEKGDG